MHAIRAKQIEPYYTIYSYLENASNQLSYSNRISTAVSGEADSVSSLSASACHIGWPKSVGGIKTLI